MNNLVEIKNNQTLTNSLIVAKTFEKRHDNVMQAVNELIKTSPEKLEHLFSLENYDDLYERKQKCYVMTRDGFNLLAMGFTGKKALQFKLCFIDAFNKMEIELLKSTQINLSDPATILKLAQSNYENHIKRIEAEKQLELVAPKIEYYNNVLQSENLITTTIIAKELGMSAITLNKKLKSKGIIYRHQGTWIPYDKYENKELLHSKTYTYEVKGEKYSKINFYWTQKGREFVLSLFTKQQIPQ